MTITRYRMRSVTVAAVALALAGLSGCSSAPTAETTASPAGSPSFAVEDETFVAALGAERFDLTKEQSIESGRRACDALAQGLDVAAIRKVLVQKGLNEAQASRVMLAAAKVYCPEFEKVVNP